MNLKKILRSKYNELSAQEKKESRMLIIIILSIFIFIIPWIFALFFLKEISISELKAETLIGLSITVAIYIKVVIFLVGWAKRGPEE